MAVAARGAGGQGPIEHAKITAIFPDSNAMTLEWSDNDGTRQINIDSIFASMNSGRRAMPEVGSWVVLAFRSSDMSNPTIVRYVSEDEYAAVQAGGQLANPDNATPALSDATKSRRSLVPYRVLQPGELEDFSSGSARSFASSRGRWEFWAGNVMLSLDRDDLDAGFFTPEFFLSGAHADIDGLADSLRFGVISRFLGGSRTKTHVEHQGEFAKEFSYNLTWLGNPNSLVTHQEGIVMDGAASPIKEPVTGHNLRRLKIYGTTTGTQTREHIDERGNLRVVIAPDADQGIYHEAVGGNSNWVQKIGRNIERKVGLHVNEQVGGNESSQVGGNHTKTIGGNSDNSSGGNTTHTSGGNHIIKASMIYIN